MAYDLYPAVDETYNFPPEVREALSKSPELRGTIVPMTTTDRNNLTAAEKWNGRVIFNTDDSQLQQYNSADATWGPTSGNVDYSQFLIWKDQSQVAVLERVLQRTDTRSVTMGYTGGNLTSVTEKDGTTTVKTTTLNYDGTGKLQTTVEVAGGVTVTTTLSYDGSGNLTGTTRAVS